MTQLKQISRDVKALREKLIEKRPSHFRERDIINAGMSALLFGLIFVFKGNIFAISFNLPDTHLWAIFLTTSAILTFEIYFIGYTRVENKKQRPFGQFWAKRFATLYGMSMFTSFFLIYLFNLNAFLSAAHMFRLVLVVSMPCAIGAAVPSLLKRY